MMKLLKVLLSEENFREIISNLVFIVYERMLILFIREMYKDGNYYE